MTDSEPLVAVHLSLGSHGSPGVPFLTKVEKEWDVFFIKDDHFTKNVIWAEDASASTERVAQLKQLLALGESYQDAFYLNSALFMNGRLINEVEQVRPFAEKVKAHIRNSQSDTTEVLFNDEFGQLIDRLIKKGHNLDYEFESAGPDKLPELEATYSYVTQLEKDTRNRLLTTRLPAVISYYRHYLFVLSGYMRERNQVCLSTIYPWIDNSLATGEKLRMAIRIGEAHDGMGALLRTHYSELDPSQLKLTLSYDHGQHRKYPSDLLAQRMEHNPLVIPSDEDVLKAIAGQLIKVAQPKGLPPVESIYAVNKRLLELTTRQLARLIASFSSHDKRESEYLRYILNI